uniref:Ig-like domain-containing protein n=1 Tax=Labrus bergylta TaxID=56723 RepID=A0A3Q3E6W7_9LABR
LPQARPSPASLEHVFLWFVSDSLILRLEPNRLQFFEYESLIFHCEGSHDSTGLKIVHRSKGELLKCNTTVTSKRSSCTIPNIFPEDSGQYWCESGDRNRSDIIHINVTADPVILESPISVVEGETVTLRCRRKTTSTNLSADFYKDGRLIRRSSTGNMRIPSVSKHDEGFYKCISGGRESAKSLMAVQGETHQCYQIKFKNTCDITRHLFRRTRRQIDSLDKMNSRKDFARLLNSIP